MYLIAEDNLYASANGDAWSYAGYLPVEYPGLRYQVAMSFLGDLWVMSGLYDDYYYYIPPGDDAIPATFYFPEILRYSSNRAASRRVLAPWPLRGGAVSVVFHDRLWLLGGFTSPEGPVEYDTPLCYLSDVWYTEDGETWVEATSNAPWGPRALLECVVFQNQLWLIGGFDGQNVLNDVWTSSDGLEWTCQTAGAPFPPRANHGVTVFNDSLWVIAGVDGQGEPPVDNAGDACYGGLRNTTPLSDVWVYTPESGEGEGSPCAVGPTHSADLDGSATLSLNELLRVIQFFNSGNFGCQVGTEDGFAPGVMDHDCCPHNSDYVGGHSWGISLTELLRLVQFYNAGGYHACPTESTEDGYCPKKRGQ